MSQAARKEFFSPEEYLALERESETRHEYLDGEIFALAGASRPHNRIASNLVVALSNRLAGRECDVYSSDLRVQVEATGLFTYPDVVVTCGEERFADEHLDTLLNPLLIVEILSASTEAYDRGKKFEHYQQIGSLREFVLVSQDERRVERFLRQDGSWRYEMFGSGTVRGAEMELESLGISLPFSEIYRRSGLT